MATKEKPVSENPADYTQFEELWDIMEEAVNSHTYDVVPTDWRTIPELGDDPDDEETADLAPKA
jgi:hypothetical protein